MPKYRRVLHRPDVAVADLRNVTEAPSTAAVEVTPEAADALAQTSDPPTYRELQQQAIALGISGRQTREELEAAIAEASDE